MAERSPRGNPKSDAKGQFAPSQADGKSSGVASAKPTVITGSEDGTAHRNPPGKRREANDFDPNYDPRDMNEGQYRG